MPRQFLPKYKKFMMNINEGRNGEEGCVGKRRDDEDEGNGE